MATVPILPYEIPQNEIENYFRMQLLLEHAADVLRDVLRAQLQAAYPGQFDPSKTDKLFNVLDNQQVKHILLLLKKRKVMNWSQMKLLYPFGTPSTTVTTQDLDITLAVVLLRNITNLNPHAKWENPPASDTSTEANIGRVKTYRNKYAHNRGLGITDTAFQAEFNDLKCVLLSLSPKYTSDDYDKLLIVPLEARVAPCQLLSVQLPQKLADLKGREDLVQQIQQHIAGETRVVLLTGMGGIGKTSVAVEVGHREKNVLYIDMREATNLESVKLSLVQFYHPTRSLKDLYSDFQNIFVQTLSSLTSDTVIIFDNNDEVIKSNLQEFHSLIQCISNSTKHITLLCTSREAFSLVSHNMAVIDVPPLDKAPSVDILWEGKPTIPTDDESVLLGELAVKCGGNPLALKLLAFQLKKKTVQRVLDRMKNKNVIESLRVANLPASQEMMACLDMSYETLTTEEQKVFRALHIFPVPFSFEEVSKMLEIDEDECETILDSLCNKSLLSADPSYYDLHPLLKAYAAFQAGTDQNEITRIQDAYCTHYMNQTPLLLLAFGALWSKETYVKVQKLLPHLKVIAYLLLDQLGNKKLHDEIMTFMKLKDLYSIARVFQNVFLYPEALTILRTLELYEGKGLPFEQIGSFIFGTIGDVLQGMGTYKEAIKYHKKSLAGKKAILGEKHPATASAYKNVGYALCYMGKFAEALTHYENFLGIQKNIFGEKHYETANAYQRIGSALCCMGKYTEAITLYQKSLKIIKDIYGEKHPNTGRTYQNMGNALCGMDKYADALTYYEKSLEIIKEKFGKKHPETSEIYQKIGNALLSMCKYAEALPYYEKSLKIINEIFGEKHPDNGRTCQNMGIAYCGLGRYAEALTYYEKSLKSIEEILGKKHPDTAGAHQNIGGVLCGMGKYQEALPYFEKSIKIINEIFGEEHLDNGRTYQNMGKALFSMEKYAEALTYYEKALKIFEKILGKKHHHTAGAYQNIGNVLWRMGKYAESLTYFEKSLEIKKEILGEKHPDTALTYLFIGLVLNDMGNAFLDSSKYAESLPCLEKAREVYAGYFGPRHDETKVLDIKIHHVKVTILNKVLMNTCKYIATELIVKGKFSQASLFLRFIGWNFKLYYTF